MTTHIKRIEGHLDASGLKIAVVASRFNSLVVDRLIGGTIDFLERHGAQQSDITVVKVPGAWELPLAVAEILRRCDGDEPVADMIVTLGAVIRGGTPHFDYVAAEVSKGIAALSMKHDTPVGFGVLTTDTLEQALERAGSKMGNKGAEAASAALEMVDVKRKLRNL